jgi:hypothetical protein
MAEKAKQPIETLLVCLRVYGEEQATIHYERSSTGEEKSKIVDYLNNLNGHVTEDLTTTEIIRGSGVRSNQGTRGFAKRELTKLLANYKPRTEI